MDCLEAGQDVAAGSVGCVGLGHHPDPLEAPVLFVLALHVILTVLCAVASGRVGPKIFLLAMLGPVSGVLLLAREYHAVTSGHPVAQQVSWVPGLDLAISLRLDPLAFLMLILVCGVGAAIFFYSAFYMDRGPTLARLAWTLTAFAGAMAGLVLADDIISLYVFWELTSITSFLLVGLDNDKKTARNAARQALIITVLGGLVMFVGLLLLARLAGSTRLSVILADPPASGAMLNVALACILVGAITKSAQVPFHIWLPGAMAAPTPVSAYLHAAAMVKAGVYLVARISPAFADLPWWRPVLVTFGIATMLVGGYRALRQWDLKRLTAFSTVSQLGFLMVVACWGTSHSMLALTTLLLAHGFAKAALFMSVGIVDHAVHTRDLRRISGLARQLPVLAVFAGIACASMAGVPPLLGFVAKETTLAGLLEHPGSFEWLVVAGVIVGSTLTVAYSARLWWGAFGTKPEVETSHVSHISAGMLAPVVLLGLGSLAAGLVPGSLDHLGAGVATAVEPTTEHLALWHGLTVELVLSAVAIAAGVCLFLARAGVERWQDRMHRSLKHFDADHGYYWALASTQRFAVLVTSHTQTGSLPQYLGATMLTVSAVPVIFLVVAAANGSALPSLDLAPHSGLEQVAATVFIVACAWFTVRSRRRLPAVLLLGGVGYGITLFFVTYGAPDLALTQLLVESVSLLLFLLVLRLLPYEFPRVPRRSSRVVRAAVAVVLGVCMGTLALMASSARTSPGIAPELVARSYPEGHGHNVVNVILVDFRGFDTLGETSVVFAAAIGVASLVLTISNRRASAVAGAVGTRSVILDWGTRILFPTTLITSLFMLFAGHNSPGGGFIGGLVAGLAFVMMYLGGTTDVRAICRVEPRLWLGVGLTLASLASILPWLFGRDILQSSYLSLELPVLGTLGVSTVLAFDTGVYLVVTGLVLTILDTLGRQPDARLSGEDVKPQPQAVGR